jgi:hypothetical protein
MGFSPFLGLLPGGDTWRYGLHSLKLKGRLSPGLLVRALGHAASFPLAFRHASWALCPAASWALGPASWDLCFAHMPGSLFGARLSGRTANALLSFFFWLITKETHTLDYTVQ